jgi:NAD(P)-dependent dehydrogenase (short-subunit alcohol dehydrogenase family)
MAGKLTGKVAVVTGGSSGIGLAIARGLIEHGAHVAIFGRRQEALNAALTTLGPNAIGIAGDVTKLEDIDRLYDEVRNRFESLDMVIASAGAAGHMPFATCTEQEFDDLIALNLKGVFFTVQRALPLLRAPASVVLVGSAAGEITMRASSVYSASKAALRSLTQSLGIELGRSGIRVNLLAPGITETPLVERLQAAQGASAAFDAMIETRTYLGRKGTPEEIAAAAVFLCSPESSYMTGGVIFVDGGLAQM